jgi:hydroxymethylbilane synthase
MTTKPTRPLIIGSRGSDLARWQAEHVASRLPGQVRIEIIKTKGDRILDTALQGSADKGFFTKELEDALLEGRVDLAVHSLKDLPTTLPDKLMLGAVSARAPIADVLLVRTDKLDEKRLLPVVDGGKVGATSLRRQALLRRYAPELVPMMLRGNVPTRVQKLRDGQYDAIILARAGLERLELPLDGLACFELNPEIWLPAPGQAVLGIELRENDHDTLNAIKELHDDTSWRAVNVERTLLSRFEGGCHAAFGAWARVQGKGMDVLVGHEDDQGRWLAARAEADNDRDAQELAYTKLRDVMKTGIEVDHWDGILAQRWQPSY